MNCVDGVSRCGEVITVDNDFAVIVEAASALPVKVSDFWLYDSFNPENVLEDHDDFESALRMYDVPVAEVFVACYDESGCDANFVLSDGACFLSSDFYVLNVSDP